MTTKELGDRIRVGRLSRGWTQGQLAEKIGVATSTITMYETGKRNPSLPIIEALADAFNVPESYFLAENPDSVSDLSQQDKDALEALHQNPKLGMLFDRQRRMSNADIDAMLAIANSILRERDTE